MQHFVETLQGRPSGRIRRVFSKRKFKFSDSQLLWVFFTTPISAKGRCGGKRS